MKKYFPFILFFSLGYSLSFTAQSILPAINFDRLPSSESFAPSNYHFFNPFNFNPAMAGIEEKQQLNFGWNRQVNNSASLSYEQPIATINSAIGLHYEYNVRSYGEMHRYGLAYNYGFRWKKNTQLRIGMQFSQVNIKVEQYSFLPLEGNEWYSFPSVDFGLAFQHKQLRLGVSIQNLMPEEFPIFNEENGNYLNKIDTKRTLNLSAANTFQLSKNLNWSVAFLLRFYSHDVIDDFAYNYFYPYYYSYKSNNQQHDFSSYISFRKKCTIGATYRTQFDPVWIGFVGVKLKEKLDLKFSFNLKKEDNAPRFWEALVQYQF